jgi:hypothetical protein
MLAVYTAPETSEIDEDHVRCALNYLISIEPNPPPESREAYDAATRPYRQQIAAAMATLRKYAEQVRTLEQMQLEYYGFTNDPRYLVSPQVSSIVCGALNEAWHGIGQWQRCLVTTHSPDR